MDLNSQPRPEYRFANSTASDRKAFLRRLWTSLDRNPKQIRGCLKVFQRRVAHPPSISLGWRSSHEDRRQTRNVHNPVGSRHASARGTALSEADGAPP